MSKENSYTKSTEISNPYTKVEVPVIGKSYHLSWGYKGARFILKEILDETFCNVYTGRTNKKLLKVKIADLLHCRNSKPKHHE